MNCHSERSEEPPHFVVICLLFVCGRFYNGLYCVGTALPVFLPKTEWLMSGQNSWNMNVTAS